MMGNVQNRQGMCAKCQPASSGGGAYRRSLQGLQLFCRLEDAHRNGWGASGGVTCSALSLCWDCGECGAGFVRPQTFRDKPRSLHRGSPTPPAAMGGSLSVGHPGHRGVWSGFPGPMFSTLEPPCPRDHRHPQLWPRVPGTELPQVRPPGLEERGNVSGVLDGTLHGNGVGGQAGGLSHLREGPGHRAVSSGTHRQAGPISGMGTQRRKPCWGGGLWSSCSVCRPRRWLHRGVCLGCLSSTQQSSNAQRMPS